jgi:hypothetical protein
MRSIFPVWFLGLAAAISTALAQTPAAIRGRVLDARTGEALANVRVQVSGSSTVTSTGRDGIFELQSPPTGPFQLRVSAPSYALRTYQVPAAANRDKILEIALQNDADTLKTSVTVATSVFEGLSGSTAPSEQTLNKAELQALGTSLIGDPLRSLQALPSVTSTNDARGEISIRGSSYDKVALMVDGIFLDGFLHQLASETFGSDRDRASFSIITADRISDVSILNSAFPANFGMRSAGIVQLNTRDGNRERPSVRISTGLTLGTSIVVDGPFAKKRGSYLVGARSSALNPFNGSADGITAGFDDGQVKLLYDLTARHRIGVSALGGGFSYNDKKTPLTEGRNTLTQANSGSLAAMATWDWTLSPRLIAATKLFQTQVGLNALNREGILLGRLPRRQWGGRQDWSLQTGAKGRVEAGLYVRNVIAEGNGFLFADRLQQIKTEFERFRGSTTEGNYYALLSQPLAPGLTLTAGVRAETNRLTNENFASPRAALAWNPGVGDGRLTLRAGFGRHRQFAEIGDLLGLAGTRGLKAESTDHYTANADLRLTERSRLRVELFERRDRNQIFRFAEPRISSGRIVDTATRPGNDLSGRARGFELMLQRRSGNRFSGWASYAYLSTRMQERTTGLIFPTDFDQRHTYSLFGAYRISKSWTFNSVYRASSGQPFAAFLRRGANGQYFLSAERNALRLNSYGRLDARINKTVNWGPTRWSFTLEGLNLLNQGNKTFNGIERFDPRTGLVLNPVTLYGFERAATAGIVVQF